ASSGANASPALRAAVTISSAGTGPTFFRQRSDPSFQYARSATVSIPPVRSALRARPESCGRTSRTRGLFTRRMSGDEGVHEHDALPASVVARFGRGAAWRFLTTGL